MAEKISQEEAVERIRQADHAYIVVADAKPVPTIGEVDPDEQKFTHHVQTFETGDSDLEFRESNE